MAVSLTPKTNVRKMLTTLFRRSGVSLENLARQMEITPSLLESYLSVEIVPDPAAYLKLRTVLKASDEERGLDHWYIALLARQQPPQKRTSKIKKKHVILAGAPDPLTAKSPEDLVEKLRETHRWALKPSLRELEERTGKRLKRSTIGDMLHPGNNTLPRFDRYALFLEACGVPDLSYWIAAWRKLAPPAQTARVRMIEETTYVKYSVAQENVARQQFLSAS